MVITFVDLVSVEDKINIYTCLPASQLKIVPFSSFNKENFWSLMFQELDFTYKKIFPCHISNISHTVKHQRLIPYRQVTRYHTGDEIFRYGYPPDRRAE